MENKFIVDKETLLEIFEIYREYFLDQKKTLKKITLKDQKQFLKELIRDYSNPDSSTYMIDSQEELEGLKEECKTLSEKIELIRQLTENYENENIN